MLAVPLDREAVPFRIVVEGEIREISSSVSYGARRQGKEHESAESDQEADSVHGGFLLVRPLSAMD
jgi:hypothetical protein